MAGSSVDREIRITASDTGVFDRLNKLKESALAMGRGIAEDARKQATSSRELIKLMNDEIALIEKRNKLNKEARELGAQEKFADPSQRGALSKELQKISVESKEDRVQSDLLKQILQAVLKTSQDEVTADREGVKAKIRSDKDIDAMEDHEQALQAMMSKQMVRDIEPDVDETKEEAAQKSKSHLAAMGGFIRETDMYTMGFGGSSEFLKSRAPSVENKLGKRALLAGGMILGGLGMTISAASDEIESRGDIFRATGGGGGVGRIKDLSTAQANRRAAQLHMAGGERLDSTEVRRMISFERAQGVNSEKLAMMARFSGPSREGGGPGFMMGFMKDVMKDRDMAQAKTNDLLEASLSMQEQEFMATGKGSGFMNTAILNRLMSGQEKASAKRASATIGRLGGMIEGGNEQLEAVKFSEYQRQYGGGYLDYLREKEKGVSGKIDDVVVNKILGK